MEIEQTFSTIKAIGFVSIALIIPILSLVPQPPELIEEFVLGDKIMHLIAYIALALSMCFILPSSSQPKRTFLSVLIISSLYGAVIEYLQRFTGRTPEGMDLLFDAAGAAIGILVYLGIRNIESWISGE